MILGVSFLFFWDKDWIFISIWHIWLLGLSTPMVHILPGLFPIWLLTFKTWLCLLFLVILVGSVDAVTLLLIQQPNFPLLLMTLSFLLWLIFHLVLLMFVRKMLPFVSQFFKLMNCSLSKKNMEYGILVDTFDVYCSHIVQNNVI